MAGKEKSVASDLGVDVVSREPWQHGDKPVVYIHVYYWNNMTSEQQEALKVLADVIVVPDEPTPETPEA